VGSEREHALDWDRLQESMGDTPAGRDLRATHAVDDALALVASWTMGRAEMEAWSEDEKAFPGGTPLNTDDHPYIEFVAPRRNVMAPIDAARAASAQHAAMSAAAGDSREAVFGLLPPDPEPDRVAQLYRELARRYARAEQKQRAYAALDKAIDALPDDALAQVQTAELLLESGRQVEALGRLSIAVRLDPDDVHAWDLLEEIASDRRDYPLVEKANRAILRREPGNVDAWLRLGAALARQSRWGEAEEAIVWARRLDPDAPIDAELERYIASRAKQERTARR
jgi:tetratricopeptide (TPR) repeat protein